MKKILKAIGEFCAYLFIPQKTDKTRYHRNPNQTSEEKKQD